MNNRTDYVRPKFYLKSVSSSGAVIKNQASNIYKEGFYPAYSASGQDVWLPDYMYEGNALIISAVGARCGKVFLASGKWGLCANTHVLFVNEEKSRIKFLYYILNNENWWKKGGSAQPFVLVNDSLNQEIYLPGLAQHDLIVSKIDTVVNKLDRLIEIEERQLRNLQDFKQSLICKAITKGLNKNVVLKDSGIEWIGEIPNHWNKVYLSSIFKEHKNKNTNLVCTNLLSLSYGKIKQKNINTSEGLLPENFEGYNIVEKEDIVLRLTDLQNDHTSLRVGISNETGIITSAYVTLRKTTEAIIPKFYYYLLHTYDIEKGFYGMGAGVRQVLNFDGLKRLELLLCSVEEQQEIVDYLDKKCVEIEKLVNIKQQKIEKLQEYKKSLIYEYVTGKREVKEG